MSTKETSYVIKIDAELADLKKKVNDAKNSLDGLLKSGQAPKGLISSFERVETILGRIQDQTKMPASKGLFTSMQKDINKASFAFGDLIRNIQALGDAGSEVKLELFSAEEQAKIRALKKGLSDYEKSLDAIAEKEKAVAKARKTKESAEKNSASAKATKTSLKGKKDKAVAKKQNKEAQIALLSPENEKEAKQIAKLRAEINELEAEIGTLTTKYNTAAKALTDANKVTKEASDEYTRLNAILTQTKTNKLSELSKTAEHAGVSINKINGETATDEIERLGAAMELSLNTTLSSTSEKIDSFAESMNEVPTILNNASESIKEAGDSYKYYSEQQDKVSNTIQKVTK